jgi:hypothetical protein
VSPKTLRCDKCGATPFKGSPAKTGGVHYVKRAHRFDASKNGAATIRYSSCGTWQEARS